MYYLRTISYGDVSLIGEKKTPCFEAQHNTYNPEDAWKFIMNACKRNHDYVICHDSTTRDTAFLFWVDNACCYSAIILNTISLNFKVMKDIVITT